MGSRGVFKKESYVDTSPCVEDEEKNEKPTSKEIFTLT